MVVGWQKRELVKQVLSILGELVRKRRIATLNFWVKAQSTALGGLAHQYQGLLKAAAAEEATL